MAVPVGSAPISEITNVEWHQGDHLYWRELHIDPPVDSIDHPDHRFLLVSFGA